jgi:uncharacterized alpha-E superfamily protein
MGRYMERADNVARFVNVNLQLILDAPAVHGQQWEALITASGDSEDFQKRYREPSHDNVIRFLLFDRENPNSVASCVRSARENARSIRDTITADMWEPVNRLYLYLSNLATDRPRDSYEEVMVEVRRMCQQFQGAADSSLSQGEAWHFLHLGRMIERADKTTRILDVKYFLLLPRLADVDTPIDDIQWSAVLRSVSGLQMYRMRHGRIVPLHIVEFMILDESFPRSVRHCVAAAADALKAVASGADNEATRVAESLRSQLDAGVAKQIVGGGLHEFIDSMQVSLNELGVLVSETYFSSQPVLAMAALQMGTF